MNVDFFMKRFADILMHSAHDDTFETLKLLTGGTTSPRIAKLLNFAVSQMASDECYIEVGVFMGGTLCSAAYANGKSCIGIDKYDREEIKTMFHMDATMVRDRCLHNITSICPGVQLIEKDFRLVAREEIGYPVAVSFIDGAHLRKDVLENLAWLEPFLADEAILVFDDINYWGVTKAIFDWSSEHSENYDLIAYVKPHFSDDNNTYSLTDRFLNNGVCILRYHKDPRSVKWVIPREETFT